MGLTIPWACSRYGDYEHDWLDCPECQANYERLNEMSEPLRSRQDFPAMLNVMELVGEGVEVGVWDGNFALFFLEHWKGKKLHLVDPYYRPMRPKTKWQVATPQSLYEEARDAAVQKMSVYPGRYEFHKKRSQEAARDFAVNSLDWVNIDAGHRYVDVYEDMAAWYPKVRIGGVLAGHDYCDCPAKADGSPYLEAVPASPVSNAEALSWDYGVKSAVLDFLHRNTDYMFPGITQEEREDFRSWYIIKGGDQIDEDETQRADRRRPA